jgi:hypothetical protein
MIFWNDQNTYQIPFNCSLSLSLLGYLQLYDAEQSKSENSENGLV